MVAQAIYNAETLDTTKPIHGTIKIDHHKFEYEVYLLPILGAEKAAIEQDLVRRLGGRMRNGKHCLDIDEAVVSRNIENGEYTAVAFVKNKHHDDVASGTLQYYDWCNAGKPQMWINDLCRISTNKQATSPVKVLLKLLESVTIKHTKRLRYINLMVDNENQEQAQILLGIYKKYGFEIIKKRDCAMNDRANEYTLMRKRLDRTSPSRNRKSRTSRKGRKTRINKGIID